MKRTFIIFSIATILFTGCKNKKTDFPFEANPISQAIKLENQPVTKQQLDRIPEAYRVIVKDGGTIEHITYESKNYYGDGQTKEKKANVYLPAGYDKSKNYKVLYLMHGIGGDENEWGMKDDQSLIKKIMDNLTVKGDIEPFIIVTPNGRSGSDPDPNKTYLAFDKFD